MYFASEACVQPVLSSLTHFQAMSWMLKTGKLAGTQMWCWAEAWGKNWAAKSAVWSCTRMRALVHACCSWSSGQLSIWYNLWCSALSRPTVTADLSVRLTRSITNLNGRHQELLWEKSSIRSFEAVRAHPQSKWHLLMAVQVNGDWKWKHCFLPACHFFFPASASVLLHFLSNNRVSFFGLPACSEDQQLSKNTLGLKCQIGTTETSRLSH